MAPGLGPVVSTSSVFQSYEEDFRRLHRTVRECVSAATSKSDSSEDRIAAGREAAEAHRQASQALQQMEHEAKSLGALGSSLAPKLKEFRDDLAAMRRQVKEAETALQREGLGLGGDRTSEDQRTNQDTVNRLRNSSRRLDDARRTAIEAEEIGMDVMTDLCSQRESIMRTKGYIHETEDNLAATKRFLDNLSRGLHLNQLTLGLIAFLLLVTDVFIIYVKLEKISERLR